MRSAARRKARRCGLQHDALRDRDLAQARNVPGAHQPRVEVRQEAGLFEHDARYLGEVGERARMAEPFELGPRSPVAQLGLVAERKERLATARGLAGPRDRERLL